MSSFSIYTKLETLPSDLKEEAKKFIDELAKSHKKQNFPVTPTAKKANRVFGSLKGKIHLSDDFDAPLDDFKDYM